MPPPSATAPAAAPAAAAVAAPRRKQFGLSEETSRIEKMVEVRGVVQPGERARRLWLTALCGAVLFFAARRLPGLRHHALSRG